MLDSLRWENPKGKSISANEKRLYGRTLRGDNRKRNTSRERF